MMDISAQSRPEDLSPERMLEELDTASSLITTVLASLPLGPLSHDLYEARLKIATVSRWVCDGCG